MNALWTLYHPEIPAFLSKFAGTPPVLRLKEVGMNCGCEYTCFPRFAHIGPYSRYDHSLGVALIVWHFTGSREQALAGLFHDIDTPVFAHVVDFLNGDHLHQESTESGTEERIAASPKLRGLLDEYGLTVAQVADYHQYPIADNPSLALSADRGKIRAFYEDLTIGTDEAGRPELAFRTPETAAAFAREALRNSRVYVADEDRFAMQALADLLRLALDRGTLTRKDLWETEPAVIGKLGKDAVCAAGWERFCRYARIRRSRERPAESGWVRVDAKKRWIDPLVLGKGRVSHWDMEIRREMDAFRSLDFSVWLSAGQEEPI